MCNAYCISRIILLTALGLSLRIQLNYIHAMYLINYVGMNILREFPCYGNQLYSTSEAYIWTNVYSEWNTPEGLYNSFLNI